MRCKCCIEVESEKCNEDELLYLPPPPLLPIEPSPPLHPHNSTPSRTFPVHRPTSSHEALLVIKPISFVCITTPDCLQHTIRADRYSARAGKAGVLPYSSVAPSH